MSKISPLVAFPLLCIFSPIQAQQASDAGGNQASTQQSGEPTDAAPKQIAPAIDRVADELTKTRVDQNDPYGDERNEREKRDIVAQESMSTWAAWMLWAVVLQTLLAGGALWALVLDLRQNRKNSIAELRAYLSFGDVSLKVYPSKTKESGLHVEAETKIFNGGQTPAYKCIHMGCMLVLTKEDAGIRFRDDYPTELIGEPHPYVVHNGRDTVAEVSSFEDISKTEVEEIKRGVKSLYISIEVQYSDTFGIERMTQICFRLISPLVPAKKDPSGVTLGQLIWEPTAFLNEAT